MTRRKLSAVVLACVFFGSTLYSVDASAFSAFLVTGGKPQTFKIMPFSEFDASPAEGSAPLTVLFSANLRNEDAKTYEYDFDGDGKADYVGKDFRTKFTYISPGTYTPMLKITDKNGKTYEKKAIVTVSNSVSLQGSPSSPTDPWEEEGIQPYKQYFKNLNEYVDPITGFLTIKQTDLYLPGRGGLDLSIERIYNAGAVFANGVPKSAPYPWANLGNGWLLNFPWIAVVERDQEECPKCNRGDNDPLLSLSATAVQSPESSLHTTAQTTSIDTYRSYIYFADGAQFKITSMPFEHHERIHFIFEENPSGGYDLIMVDGTRYHFDANQLVSITDRTGNNTITFTYEPVPPIGNTSRISSITDTIGRSVNFNYDGNGKLVSISSGARTVTYNYTGNNLISSTDPAGRVTSYEYGTGFNSYLLSKIKYPTGGFTTYNYWDILMGCPSGNPPQYNNHMYRVKEQNIYTNTLTKKVTYAYMEETDTVWNGDYGYCTYNTGNALSSTVSIYDPAALKQTVQYVQTAYNQHTQNEYLLLTSRVITDGAGAPLRKTTYAYNTNKEIISFSEYIGNGPNFTLAYTVSQNYDNWGNVISETDPLGHSAFYSYSNTSTSNTFPASGFTNAFYSNSIDPNVHTLLLGQAMFQEISLGNKIEFYYDYTDLPPPPPTTPPPTNPPCPPEDCGRPYNSAQMTSGGSISGFLIQTKNLHNGNWIYKDFSSDAYGNITSVTEHPDAQSIITTFAYDPQYQAYLTSITKTLNGQPVTSSFIYDLNTGDVTSITDMNGNTSSYAYDILGRIMSVTFPDSSSKTASYDDSARTVTITDEKGNWVKKYFDELGRLTMVQNTAGQETYSLNYLGKVITKTDALGHQYTYEYDALGRTRKMNNSDGTYQELIYNDPLFMITAFDDNRHQKDFLYDFKQQLKSVKEYVGPSVYTTSYVYDGVGNMKSVADAKNQTTSYIYDDLNRLVQTSYTDGTRSSLTYDNVGNILSKTDQKNQVINYAYDEMNRLTRITYPDATAITYTYDNNGNRLSMTDPNSTTTYAYDNRNRLVSETKTIDGTPYTTQYSYDAASNLQTLTYPDNSPVSYIYDNLNRISEIPGYASYGYNALSQITNVGFGNTVQTAYTYDNRNRPSRIQTTKEANNYLDLNYTYDSVGNITQINNGTSSEIYSYDNLDRLVSAQLPAVQSMGMKQQSTQQQQPSTTTMLLSETTSVTTNPDGTNTATITSVPQNYVDNGVYKPIDLTIVPLSGAASKSATMSSAMASNTYDYGNVSNTFKSYFKNNTNSATFLKYEAGNGDSAEYKLGKMVYGKKNKFENPRDSSPVIEGSKITYPNVYSGVDIQYEITPLVLKESIVLNTQPALEKDTLDFEGTLQLKNVYFKEEDGSILFYDKNTDKLVFYIPQPHVQDAEGWIVNADMSMKKNKNDYTIIVSIPKKFIENATYPVTIDPSFNSEAALDGQISCASHNDTITYPVYTTGSSMGVGNYKSTSGCREGDCSNYNYSTYRSYISFDTSSIPDDATIISSYLYMKTYQDYSTARDFDNLVYRVDYGPTLDSSDWNVSGTQEGNILSTQNFVAETYYNLHVGESRINKTGRTQYMIKSSDEAGLPYNGAAYVLWYTGNSASPPRLEIVYSRPPSPSNLQITTPPDDPTPSFSWTYSDPDGDTQASFQFQIATDSNFAQIVRDSGEVASSASTYTESNALQNGTYFARVKVKDSKTLWSGWSQFIMFAISGPQIISYEYDATGNRTKKIDGDKTTTYNYNGMNQLISMVENGVTTNFFYDLNGNQIRKEKGIEKWYYTYDFENRLTKVEYFDGTQTIILGQYFYDGDGKRIKKVESQQTTIYIYQGWNIIYEKESSTMTETKHIFGPNGHVAKVIGSTKYYYHSDHLGSLKQESDDSGNALWSSPAQYDPFGEMRSGGPEKDGYFYTGKLRDTSTGLYYYGARYYDAKIGRFLTKDIMTGTASNSQTMNLYIYTLNNPLKYIDPTGNWVGAYETYTTTRSGRVVGITGAGGYHDVSGQGLFDTDRGIMTLAEYAMYANAETTSGSIGTNTLAHKGLCASYSFGEGGSSGSSSILGSTPQPDMITRIIDTLKGIYRIFEAGRSNRGTNILEFSAEYSGVGGAPARVSIGIARDSTTAAIFTSFTTSSSHSGGSIGLVSVELGGSTIPADQFNFTAQVVAVGEPSITLAGPPGNSPDTITWGIGEGGGIFYTTNQIYKTILTLSVG